MKFDAIQVVLGIVMALVTLLQAGLVLAFRSGRFMGNAANLETRVKAIEDEASARWSKVQGLFGRLEQMPESLRSKFMALETAQMAVEESRRDRAALWQEMRDIRHRVDQL